LLHSSCGSKFKTKPNPYINICMRNRIERERERVREREYRSREKCGIDAAMDSEEGGDN